MNLRKRKIYSPEIGDKVIILDKKMTKYSVNKIGTIKNYHPEIKKWEIVFQNPWVGWYKLDEFKKVDTETK